MRASKFYHTTKGYNGEIIVAAPLAYTTQATFALFVANAAEGEIGTYRTDTLALIGANVAIAANTEIFIAQKRDGQIHKTTPVVFTTDKVKKIAYVAPVKQVITISTFPAIVAKDVWSVNLFETTAANQPYAAFNYEVGVKATIQDTVDALVTLINDPLNPVNYAWGQLVVASRGSSGNNSTLVLTSSEFGRHFRVANREALAGVVTVTNTTAFVQGIGTPENVSLVEDEGAIFAGTTTNYPSPNNVTSAEFGATKKFVDVSKTYNTFFFDFFGSEQSPTPLERHWQKKYFAIFTPASGASPDLALATQFGIVAPV